MIFHRGKIPKRCVTCSIMFMFTKIEDGYVLLVVKS